MGNAKPVAPAMICLLLALTLSLFISVRAVDPAQTTWDPEEIEPVNFYVNKFGQADIIKTNICKGFQCPMYDVVNDPSKRVQERLYSPIDVVVATADCSKPFNDALNDGYMKLFSYRKGNNSANAQIVMSVPVIVYITTSPTSGTTEKTCTFEVWFYLNSTSLPNGVIPTPNDDTLQVRENISESTMYVSTFRGFIKDPQQELDKLKSDLQTLNLEYEKTEYFVAMYDNPWKQRGRRNEIWLKKKQSSS